MESTSLSSDRFPEGLRILVVDADAACLKNLEKMLTKLKYQVRVSNQGREALDMIEKRKTGLDIVISDENVGDMDGFLFVEQVGRSKTNLPVIMTSSNGETTSVMKGVQYGACDYLVKPIRLKDLRYIWKHAFRIRISTVNVKQSIDISATTTTGVNSSGDDDNDGDGDNSERRNINESSPPVKKPRVVWTPFLHSKFEEAVSQIGVECAGPKKIQELMGIPWLSRENVASHLQKYRLFLQRQKREDEVKAAYAGNNASNMLGQSGNSLTLQQNIVINKNNYCPSNVNGEGNVNMYGDSTPHYMTNNQQLQLNEPSSMALAHYNRADFNPLFQYNHFPNTDDLYDNNRHYGIGTENIPPHHTLSPHYHQQQNMNLGSRPVLRLREVELPEFPSALEDIYLQDPHTVRRDSLDYINQEGPASHDQPHSAPRDQADANDPHVWRQ